MVLYNYIDECIAIRSVGRTFIPIKDMIKQIIRLDLLQISIHAMCTIVRKY